MASARAAPLPYSNGDESGQPDFVAIPELVHHHRHEIAHHTVPQASKKIAFRLSRAGSDEWPRVNL